MERSRAGLGCKGDVRFPKSAGVQGSHYGVTVSTVFNGFHVYFRIGGIYILFLVSLLWVYENPILPDMLVALFTLQSLGLQLVFSYFPKTPFSLSLWDNSISMLPANPITNIEMSGSVFIY